MPSRTGLAATLRSLLHELGVPMRPARLASPAAEHAEEPSAASTVDDDPEAQPEQLAPVEVAAEPSSAAPAAPETTPTTVPAAATPEAAPAAPTPTAEPAKTKTPGGKFLRRIQAAALWTRDVGLGTSGFVLLVVVATAGFTASFIGLHDFGVHKMGYSDHQAWLVPTAIDGADIGLSVTALRAAMAGRSAAINRLMILACTAISSWINYEHIADWYGRRIAALLPILAVVLLESLLGEARAAYERRIRQPRPRLSLLRWVFDRRGTWAILRAYVLDMPLPEQMAQAAETVEVEKAKPRKRRRNNGRKPAGKPAAKPEEQRDDETENGGGKAADGEPSPVIDLNLVEEFGPKGAHAIRLWLDAVNNRRPISLRAIDRAIDGNGAAGLAVRKYKQKYGDPASQEAANA